jgi:hypothetical protein
LGGGGDVGGRVRWESHRRDVVGVSRGRLLGARGGEAHGSREDPLGWRRSHRRDWVRLSRERLLLGVGGGGEVRRWEEEPLRGWGWDDGAVERRWDSEELLASVVVVVAGVLVGVGGVALVGLAGVGVGRAGPDVLGGEGRWVAEGGEVQLLGPELVGEGDGVVVLGEGAGGAAEVEVWGVGLLQDGGDEVEEGAGGGAGWGEVGVHAGAADVVLAEGADESVVRVVLLRAVVAVAGGVGVGHPVLHVGADLGVEDEVAGAGAGLVGGGEFGGGDGLWEDAAGARERAVRKLGAVEGLCEDAAGAKNHSLLPPVY